MVRPVAIVPLLLAFVAASNVDAGGVVRPERVRRPVIATRVAKPKPKFLQRLVHPRGEPTLVNHGRNITWRPRASYRPGRDIDELSRLLVRLDSELPDGTSIKAGGSRHSWSPAAATDGVYIHPEKMRFIERPTALRRGLTDRSDYVRIGSGTTIREINRTLWKQGKSLPVLGGFDGQTLGGVLPTGTHGSVLKQGPLVDMVASIDLVTATGKKVRLEPSGGITDRARFRALGRGWTLIQDDEAFNAALINMGTFGVVHSYVLKATERFYLNEVRTATTGRAAQEVLRGGNIYRLMDTGRPGLAPLRNFAGHPERAYHLELLWNIHTDNMVVTSRQPLNRTRTRALEKNEPGYFDGNRNRNLLRPFFMKGEYSRPHMTELAAEYLGPVAAKLTGLVARFIPRMVPRLVDVSLRGLRDQGYTQRSYRVFNIGDGANKIPAQSATISVPLRGDSYLHAMEVMRGVARAYAAETGQFQTGLISMRFVKGSKAALGDPEDVAKFEIIFAGNGRRAQQLAGELVWRQYDALYRELGSDVRFHWGQLVPEPFNKVAAERIRESFPGLTGFERTRRRFDPKGRFLNSWQRELFAQP